MTKLADSLGVTKQEKESIKTRIEKCLPLYYKHLDSIGSANNAYNLDEFLEWFNQRDDVSEMRKSRGGWKSDRSAAKSDDKSVHDPHRSSAFRTVP